MSLSYKVIETAGYIKITAEGVTVLQEYIDLYQAIIKDPLATGIDRSLSDYRKIELSLNYDDLKNLSERIEAIGSPIKKTAVLLQNDAVYGMTRMYSSIRQSQEIQSFYNENEALDWLLKEPQYASTKADRSDCCR
jgi:hypothetical protein